MAKYIKVYLVRHGRTNCNVKKIHQGERAIRLNADGRKQAEKTAAFFKRIHLDKVYCSPIFRTMQTARIILKHHPGLEIVKCAGLKERKMGSTVGLTDKQLCKIIPDLEEQWQRDGIDWRPPGGGETLREVYARACVIFKRLVKKHKPGDTILMVTHGGILKSLLLNFKKIGPEGYLKTKTPDNCTIIEVLWNKKPIRVRHVMK
ncbi:MAG: histidine phosphatase family protein [Candidatus Woesearchaeota archaeon]